MSLFRCRDFPADIESVTVSIFNSYNKVRRKEVEMCKSVPLLTVFLFLKLL